jgi:hypothetical protein
MKPKQRITFEPLEDSGFEKAAGDLSDRFVEVARQSAVQDTEVILAASMVVFLGTLKYEADHGGKDEAHKLIGKYIRLLENTRESFGLVDAN